MLSRRKIFGWLSGLLGGGVIGLPATSAASDAIRRAVDAEMFAQFPATLLKKEGERSPLIHFMSLAEAKLSFSAVGPNPSGYTQNAPSGPPPLLAVADLHKWTESLGWDSVNTTVFSPLEVAYAVRCLNNDAHKALAADLLIRVFQAMVGMYQLGAGNRPAYWRIKPDMDTWSGDIVEYRPDGPDVCPMTDARCVVSHEYAYVKIRARFSTDDLPSGSKEVFSKDHVPKGWVVTEHIDDNAVACVKA